MLLGCIFFFKQKTAYEMRISDWSSDVCSSDLRRVRRKAEHRHAVPHLGLAVPAIEDAEIGEFALCLHRPQLRGEILFQIGTERGPIGPRGPIVNHQRVRPLLEFLLRHRIGNGCERSEEHPSELQSLMRISYAFFCLKK